MSDFKLRPIGHRTGTSLLALLPLACLLAACGPNYSPDTYSSSAVQQASKVDSGVVIGVRKVAISVDSTLASTTGAAAGGIAGSQVAEGAVSALGALGGAVVGGLGGNEVGHKVQDTFGYEYIVRKPNGDLLSLTQKDETPLKIGQRVLLIQGSQARIVSDYTVPVDTDLAAPAKKPQSPNEPKPDLSKAADVKSPPAPAPSSEASSSAAVPAGSTVTPAPAGVTAVPETAATPEAATKEPAAASAPSNASAPAASPAATAPQTATPPSSSSQAVAPAVAPTPVTTKDQGAAAKTSDGSSGSGETSSPAPGSLTHGPGSAH
jgi:outer membrane lipoprotein SlyB